MLIPQQLELVSDEYYVKALSMVEIDYMTI